MSLFALAFGVQGDTAAFDLAETRLDVALAQEIPAGAE
jgi:hypothetical protein